MKSAINIISIIVIHILFISVLSAQPIDSLATNETNYQEENFVKSDTVKEGRQELKSRRTYQSKTFLNDDGSYTLELSASFMHYKDERGKFKEIKRTFVPSSHPEYGYEVTQGLYHAYFKSDIAQPMPVLFETKERLQLQSQLWGVGYFDISSKEYHILQRTQSSIAEAMGNEVIYRNVFTDVDVKYFYNDTQLKEEIYLNQGARDRLPNPARYNMDINSTYLVFITRLDFNKEKIRYYVQNTDVTDVAYEGKDRLDFKDLCGAVKFFFPLDIAFLESERYVMDEENVIDVRKRIVKVNGERYLLAGVPLTWVRNVPEGTIVFDPVISMQPDGAAGKDAFVYKSTKPGYEYMADNNYGASAAFYIVAGTHSGYPKYYRGYIKFDLTSLPENANISSAMLNTYWANLGSPHGDGVYSRYSISSTYIRRVTQNWDESTVNWNNQPSSITSNQVSVPAPSSSTSDFSVNITNLVTDIRNSGENNGFFWRLQTEQYYRSIYLASSDHSEVARRPMLQINYTHSLTKNYYIKDHLGSIRVTINQSGSVIGYNDYYPFGLQKPGRNMNNAISSDIYKFTEKELDDENNLDWYYFGARYYDPSIGRFLTTDPMADIYPSLSPYTYCANNPLLFIDPTGAAYEISQEEYEERLRGEHGGFVEDTPEEIQRQIDEGIYDYDHLDRVAQRAAAGDKFFSNLFKTDVGHLLDYFSGLYGIDDNNYLRAVAWTENRWQHYNPDGSLAVGLNKEDDGSISSRDWGIMQVNDKWNGYHPGVFNNIKKGAQVAAEALTYARNNPLKGVVYLMVYSAYGKYNGGGGAVHRFWYQNDKRDANFRNNYLKFSWWQFKP
jgi:RHS repeat-associated protein